MKQMKQIVIRLICVICCEKIIPPKSSLTGREEKLKLRLTPVSNLSKALQRLE
jgi:hypothetical protein